MTRSLVRAGADTHVRLGRPNKNFGDGIWLRAELNAKETFIRFKSPVPKNGKVGSAYLYLTQSAALAATATISARALTTDFAGSTVTWNTKPTIGGTAATTLTKTGATPVGTVWKVDITQFLQDIANGSVNRGLSIRGVTTSEIDFFSLNAESFRPYVEVDWSTPPQKPTQLKPSYAAVSLAKWVQSCDFTDRNGTDALVSVQVQIDAAGTFGAGLWDSGTVVTDIPQVDLATTTYPGLAAAASTFVRMRVTDSSGGTSPWSDPVTISRLAKGTAVLNAPAGTVTEFTPPISWTNTNLVQNHYRVTIAKAANPKKLRLDTGRVKSAATTYTVPKKVLRDETTYIVIVQIWDNQLREGTSNDPAYIELSNTFTVAYSATVTAPTALTAAMAAGLPWVDLTITRATSPDTWTILRKETGSAAGYQAIDTDVIPGDIAISTTQWVYRDLTARPGISYTYLVKSDVNGVLSTGGPTAVITPTITGVWLVDPTTGKYVILGGKDYDGTMEDDAITYPVLGAVDVVRTVMGLTGLAGSCTLLLRSRPGFTWRDFESILYEFKSNPTATYRMVLGDLNIPVVLGDVNPAVPHPDSRPDQTLKVVSFKFWQNGEHPFEVTF